MSVQDTMAMQIYNMRLEIDDLKAENARLQCQIDGAKVSLDKFFGAEYPSDLTNQACDVREMYCKLGDENERLREALEDIIVEADFLDDCHCASSFGDIAQKALEVKDER
jgi:hypothetical protein